MGPLRHSLGRHQDRGEELGLHPDLAQKELSKLSFGIQPTHFWDPATYTEDPIARRQADVYVFCIENCKDQSDGNPNPLDLAQWEFRVLATSVLDTLGEQKTISLAQLDRLNATQINNAFDLRDAIRKEYEKHRLISRV